MGELDNQGVVTMQELIASSLAQAFASNKAHAKGEGNENSIRHPHSHPH